MFDGTFGGLDKHALVALVSCLVPVDRSNVSAGGVFLVAHCSVLARFGCCPPFPVCPVQTSAGPIMLLDRSCC